MTHIESTTTTRLGLTLPIGSWGSFGFLACNYIPKAAVSTMECPD